MCLFPNQGAWLLGGLRYPSDLMREPWRNTRIDERKAAEAARKEREAADRTAAEAAETTAREAALKLEQDARAARDAEQAAREAAEEAERQAILEQRRAGRKAKSPFAKG